MEPSKFRHFGVGKVGRETMKAAGVFCGLAQQRVKSMDIKGPSKLSCPNTDTDKGDQP